MKALLVLLAACSVPAVNLDGKQCPCAAGYTCQTSTNTCKALVDAKRDDTGGSNSCLGSAPGASLYSDSFDGAMTFTTLSGTWSQSGGQLVQTDTTGGLAVAYTTNSATNVGTYRVVAAMTGMTPGTAMGIAVRITAGMRQQYDCLWEPGTTGTLLWQSVNNGGNATTLGTPTVGVPTSLAVTMEVLATPTMIKCCIDNLSGAVNTVNNPSPTLSSGVPGLATLDMHAAFDGFDVYAN